MSLSHVLTTFQDRVSQCEHLVVSAHTATIGGTHVFTKTDLEQITIAAFLNLFKAWEDFLESSILHFMSGHSTIKGIFPTRYVSPPTLDTARNLVIGVMKYFDYGNHEHVKKIVNLYFEKGYPFEPYLNQIFSQLQDLRTMRNAAAHIASTTQTSLEGLATRLFGMPKDKINLYQLLTAPYPTESQTETIFTTYKKYLVITAELIASG